MIVEQSSNSLFERPSTSDLEDLNRTLYDIGAQDLLDVWQAMESEDPPVSGANGNANSFTISSSTSLSTSSSNPGSLFNDVDSLNGASGNGLVLKDRLLTDSVLLEEFPVAVKHEHSYSMGAGSDGDSIPASPISLQDDMETECYPCIPMQSASNQRKSVLKQQQQAFGEAIVVKTEPMSCDETSIDVVDDHEGMSSKPKNNSNSLLKSAAGGSSLLLRPQQHTVHFARPKHPQSLLKQKPVTHTILVTTPGTSLPSTTSISNSSNNNSIVKEANSFDSSKLLFSRLGASVTTPSLMLQQNLHKAQPIHTSLISSQPADANGVLILTEEEKKTLISEGYPIPTKLPLTKAEEKSLKKIRRKIKNKISAQESRRKKKEFVDTLERQVEVASHELSEYKRKCQELEKENATLMVQLKSLRAMVLSSSSKDQIRIKLEPPSSEGASSVCDGLGLD